MPANLENSAVPQDWKRSVFIPIPKKGNAKQCSNYCTIALISHASKVMRKILQARFQQYVNHEPPDVQAGFRKGRGTRNPIANIRCIIKKNKRIPEKQLLLLYWLLPLTGWITTNWKILQEMGIPYHLTCLLRNLYARQEATVRTGHGTMNWFQLGKEYIKAVYCHLAYLTYMQFNVHHAKCWARWSTSWNQGCWEKYQ